MSPNHFNSIKEAFGLLKRLKNNTGAKTNLGAIGAGLATVATSAVAGAVAGGAGFAGPGAAIGGAYAAYKVTQKNSDFKKTKKVDPTHLVRDAKTMKNTSSSILNALKKRKTVTESEQLDEKRTPKKLGKVLINNLMKKAAAKKHAQEKPKGQKTADKIKKPKAVKEDITIFEDWKDHQKAHKDKAKEYAGKIKALLDDYCQNSHEYDTWDIKDISRRLEDMYEGLDNSIERKKKYAKSMAKVAESTEQFDESQDISNVKRYISKTKHAAKTDSSKKDDLKTARQELNFRKNVNTRNQVAKRDAKRGGQQYHEEVEQLDELSKKTLKSYVKKANTSLDRTNTKMDREEDKAMSTDGNKYPAKQNRHLDNARALHKTYMKRTNGLNTANKKLKEDEVPEKIEELSKPTLGSYVSKAFGATKSKGNDLKTKNRKAGVAKATNKYLAKEEQLEELSKPTLKSYVNKSLKNTADIQNKKVAVKSDAKTWGKLNNKHLNRISGIMSAKQKLAKEEAESVVEAKKPEKKKFKDFMKDKKGC